MIGRGNSHGCALEFLTLSLILYLTEFHIKDHESDEVGTWTGIFILKKFLEKCPHKGSEFVLKSRKWENEGH
jgi:hypothetical protein